MTEPSQGNQTLCMATRAHCAWYGSRQPALQKETQRFCWLMCIWLHVTCTFRLDNKISKKWCWSKSNLFNLRWTKCTFFNAWMLRSFSLPPIIKAIFWTSKWQFIESSYFFGCGSYAKLVRNSLGSEQEILSPSGKIEFKNSKLIVQFSNLFWYFRYIISCWWCTQKITSKVALPFFAPFCPFLICLF